MTTRTRRIVLLETAANQNLDAGTEDAFVAPIDAMGSTTVKIALMRVC